MEGKVLYGHKPPKGGLSKKRDTCGKYQVFAGVKKRYAPQVCRSRLLNLASGLSVSYIVKVVSNAF